MKFKTESKRMPLLGAKASALIASCMLACVLGGCAAEESVPQESVEQALLTAADNGEFAAADYVEASAYRLESCEVAGQEKKEDGATAVTARTVIANDSFNVEAQAVLNFAKEGDGWVLAGSDFAGTKVKAIKGVDYLVGPADQASLSGDSSGAENKEPLSGCSGAEAAFDEVAQTCTVTLPVAQDGGNWFARPASNASIEFVFDGKKWANVGTESASDYTSDYLGQTFTDGPCSVTLVNVTESVMQVEFAWSGEKYEQDPDSEYTYLPGTYAGLAGQGAVAVPFEASATYSGEYSLGDSAAVNKYSQQSGKGFVLTRDSGFEDTDTPSEFECRFTADKSLSMTWSFQDTTHQAMFKLS